MKKFFLVSAAVILSILATGSAVVAADLNRSRDEIALWNGPSPGLGTIVYTLDLDLGNPVPRHKVFEGVNIGRPSSLFDDEHFFDSLDRRKALFTFSPDGRRIYAGPTVIGTPLYYLESTGRFIRVHRGPNTIGPILYTFTENRVYEGANTQGPIVLTTERNLLAQNAPVIQVIMILLEMAPRLGQTGAVGLP